MSPIDAGAIVGDVISAPVLSSAVAGDGKITYTWPAVSGATAYDLLHRTSAAVTKRNGTKVVGVTSPHDLTTANGTEVWAVLVAQDAETESEVSFELSATPGGPPPAQPTGEGLLIAIA